MTSAAVRVPERQSPKAGASKSLVEGDLTLTEDDFRRIAAMLHEDSGIHLPDGKATLVYSRLAKRLRALGMQSFRDYTRLLSTPEGQEERQSLLNALTTNVTRFYREPHHFEDLKALFESSLARHAEAGGRVRLWSSACSSGEEPYSMALTVLSVLPSAPKLDVKILATDIDSKIVARARTGAYEAGAVSPVPSALRDRWMRRDGEGWSVGPEARSLISFRELNLMTDWPMKGKFDVIFCRNVAIYFEEATQERLWSRFAGKLMPQGKLYIGHSERIGDPQFRTAGLTAYVLAGAKA